MNSARFDNILRQVLIVPIFAVLLGAAGLYWQIHDANRTVGFIQAADDRITHTLFVERLILDQETGLRGYQTTNDDQFLDPYYTADKQLDLAFFKLSNFYAIGTPQRTLADHFITTHNAWEQGFAVPLIATMRAGGHTNDPDLNVQGKHEMDAVRLDAAALTRADQASRDAAISHWKTQVRHMETALGLSAVFVGLIIGLYTRVLIHDISEAFKRSNHILRKRAEEAFRAEQRLRTTLASIGDGVITCDPTGLIQTINPVAQELTGWAEAEAHNQPLEHVFRIINETTREPVENPVTKVGRLKTVVGLANHTLLIRKDGTEICIDDSGAPIRDKQGELIGIVLVFRDVTISRKSQAALLANEKLAVAGRLAATIAHEIHNPLDSVSNLLFLMDGESTPAESAAFLQLAKQEVSRVTQISRAMLSLYRESRAPVPIDLKELLESILLLMNGRLANLQVTVTPDLPANLIVQGFPAELRQVFTNLISNAAEAASPSGHVHLTAEPEPAYPTPDSLRTQDGVLITVEDDGPGIDAETRARLFQPFFTTKGEQGTGLGLWVSRGILTKHGATINLASSTDSDDHGTTVTVFLATNPTIQVGGD
ncbi:ATP-binding protein [Granulicella tundricola]|uniref:histidine kinase n=1 Tax=Granulicella tundricola (strain ATCC BAA-1859 / DSM 23138 / MP5ACTX9) TaxID=1198114 RepID=E8WYR6_GRATM|nr:ATP-binding protein [Granulicella tundricola]ADW68752.1 multi-sensor signal transduction histidine kinase [Granulicella tundricola MP5ACTX9]